MGPEEEMRASHSREPLWLGDQASRAAPMGHGTQGKACSICVLRKGPKDEHWLLFDLPCRPASVEGKMGGTEEGAERAHRLGLETWGLS